MSGRSGPSSAGRFSSLAQRRLVEISARVAAHPARTELARVSHLPDAARVVTVYAAVVILHATLDAFFVVSSECARLHGSPRRSCRKNYRAVDCSFQHQATITHSETACRCGYNQAAARRELRATEPPEVRERLCQLR